MNDQDFVAQLEALGSREINAIVRVTVPLEVARERLAARGVHVRRELKLIRGLAVTAAAHTLLALTREDWITSVEPDRKVHAMR